MARYCGKIVKAASKSLQQIRRRNAANGWSSRLRARADEKM
jgi:hypothetical protein